MDSQRWNRGAGAGAHRARSVLARSFCAEIGLLKPRTASAREPWPVRGHTGLLKGYLLFMFNFISVCFVVSGL